MEGHLHECARSLAIVSLKDRMEMNLSMFSVFWSVFQLYAAAYWKEERPREELALGSFTKICVAERTPSTLLLTKLAKCRTKC